MVASDGLRDALSVIYMSYAHSSGTPRISIFRCDPFWGCYTIDSDEDITLVNDQDDANMFNVNTLTGDEVLAEQEVAPKDVNLTVDEVTLAQALAALKSVKPKVKANVVEEPSVPVSIASIKVSATTTTTTAIIQTPRKGIVITEL
ncbi:hypothetical protein Tco_1098852, partial [Tanacetum coccineum]